MKRKKYNYFPFGTLLTVAIVAAFWIAPATKGTQWGPGIILIALAVCGLWEGKVNGWFYPH